MAGHAELRELHTGPLLYPPRGRSRKPLLRGTVQQTVKGWVFAAGTSRSFNLTCDFVLSDSGIASYEGFVGVMVAEPLRMRITTSPVLINTRDSANAVR